MSDEKLKPGVLGLDVKSGEDFDVNKVRALKRSTQSFRHVTSFLIFLYIQVLIFYNRCLKRIFRRVKILNTVSGWHPGVNPSS